MNRRDLLRAVSLAATVAACSAPAPTSSVLPTVSSAPSGPASPGLSPASSPATAEPTALPEPTDGPAPTDVPAESAWSQHPPEPLLIGTAVRVLATELNIRGEPSTSARRVDTFRAGNVIVVSELPPVDADGYTWYSGTGPYGEDGELWPLPHPAGAGTDQTYGWFAARKGAVRYVEPATSRCPTVIDIENLGAMTPAERLECFGGRTIEFEGSFGCPGCIPEVPGSYEPGWLVDPNEVNLVSNVGAGLGGLGLNLRFAPTIDGRPEIASIITVHGHFDDPRASECTIAMVPWNATPMAPPHLVPSSIARLWCRQMFVVESYEVTGTDSSYEPL